MSGHGNRAISGLRFSLSGRPFFAATWVPEGIVLTPRTAADPYGYGFPKRDRLTGAKINPPFGTRIAAAEDEALNQVLINRFPNNKYLDRLGFVSGIPNKENGDPLFEFPETNDRLRASLAVELTAKPFAVVYWPLWYEPKEVGDAFWNLSENKINWTDVPGVNRWSGGYNFKTLPKPPVEDGELTGDIPSRQFDDSGEPLIFEPESEEWYCHWPEELLYDNDAFEAIFQETNRYRALVGREPLHRELRGYANTGRMILSEMQRAEVMFHEDEDRYRPGYGTVFYRASNGGHTVFMAGENLLAGISGFSWDSGVEAALGWRNSPLHYANMISTSWKTRHTSLDVFGNVAVTLTEKGSVAGESSILDQTFDPPFSGRSWAQFFTEHGRWLYAGFCEFKTVHGSITTDSFASPMGKPFTIKLSGGPFIYYKGQAFFVDPLYERMFEEGVTYLLGACLYKQDNVLSFLVVYSYYDNSDQKYYITYITRPIAVHNEWIRTAPVLVDEFGGYVQCFQFYAQGTSGFVTAQYTNASILYNTHFTDFPSDAVGMYPSAMRVISFDLENGFSFGAAIRPSDVTYSVSESSFGDGRLDVSHTGQSIEGGDLLHPFINENYELDYLKREWVVDYDHHWTSEDDIVFNFSLTDTLIFPSEKRVSLRDISYSYTGEHNTGFKASLSENPTVSFLFYVNPKTEDCFVGRVSLSNAGGNILGALDILYGGDIIKSYSAVTLHSNVLLQATGVITSSGPYGSYGGNGIDSNDIGYNRFPFGTSYAYYNTIPARNTQSERWFCQSHPSLRKYPNKLIKGVYPASFTATAGVFNFCYLNDAKTAISHGYDFGLPVIYYPTDSAIAIFLMYKNKFVLQLDVVTLFGFGDQGLGSLTPSEDDRRTIYSNIESLNEVIGIGELTDLMPMGVIP